MAMGRQGDRQGELMVTPATVRQNQLSPAALAA